MFVAAEIPEDPNHLVNRGHQKQSDHSSKLFSDVPQFPITDWSVLCTFK